MKPAIPESPVASPEEKERIGRIMNIAFNTDGVAQRQTAIAAEIRAAVKAEREACAMLHESVDVACDHERQHGHPGAGAMAAVIQYRDLIRARGKE